MIKDKIGTKLGDLAVLLADLKADFNTGLTASIGDDLDRAYKISNELYMDYIHDLESLIEKR